MVRSDSSNSSTDEGNTIPRPKQQSAKKRWCLTLNNYTEDEEKMLVEWISSNSSAILGREVGESGTPHIQGYFELKTKLRFTALKKVPCMARCHLEEAKGNKEQNEKYCSKGEIIINTLKKKNVNYKYDEWLEHDKEFMGIHYPDHIVFLLRSDKYIFAEFVSWLMCEKKIIPLIFDNNRRIGMVNTLYGYYRQNMSAEMFLSKDEIGTKIKPEILELYRKKD